MGIHFTQIHVLFTEALFIINVAAKSGAMNIKKYFFFFQKGKRFFSKSKSRGANSPVNFTELNTDRE